MKTNIEWTSHTWNPYTWNCTKVSPGCKNCYAEALAGRYKGKSHGGQFAGPPVIRPTAWAEIRSSKRIPSGSIVFVNSMSDTFHEGASPAMIHAIFNTALYTRPDVTFLVLTKRPERAYAMRDMLTWPKNLWLGTSVENSDYLPRLDYLLETPAAGHFVSAEPLLGSLAIRRSPDNRYTGIEEYLHPVYVRDLNEARPVKAARLRYNRLKWVIVGAESGGDRRPFDINWVREIRDMCRDTGTPFMYKQGSAFKPGQNRMLDGRTWSESPFGDVR